MSATLRFENYEVLHRGDGSVFELGRGAMGVTYKARDVDLHCDVALKIINPGILGDPEAHGRFLREARAAARLRHPNIASVFRLGKAADQTHFYAMEFCEGPTLEQAVAKNGPMPAVEALRIVMQVSEALMLAEEHQLLHRDLKPSNLILTARRSEGTVVKVIDFGLARSFADGHQTLASHGSSGFVGTAHFASPEQLEEQDLDIRSDIYSLGVCLWFMLDGRPPFAGSLARVMSQTLSAEPPWERLAAQPSMVVDLLRPMLAKDRDDRPATVADLRRELDECLRAIQAPTNGGDIVRKPPAANRGLEEWEFATRYPMSAEVGSETLGRIFRGADANHGGAPVAVRIIDAALVAVPATRREVEAQIAAARAHPHPHLIALLDHATSSHGLCVASEWIEGFSLLDLLKHRGALAPGEVLRLLTPLADAVDHATRQGIRGMQLAKQQVHVHFPNGLSDGERENVLTSPLEEWPPHVVKAGVLSLGDEGRAGSRGMQSMMTLVPSGGGGAINGIPALARLACELLGSRADAAFAPIARLSEAGNAVLRRACTDPAAFPTAAEFVEQFRATLGRAGSSVPMTRASASPVSANSPPAPFPLFKPLTVAILALLLITGLGAGFWFGIHQPRERDREKRQNQARAVENNLAEKQRLVIAEQEPKKKLEENEMASLAEEKRKADEAVTAEKQRQADAAKKAEEQTKNSANATKEQPFVNSLGMKFVPVPGTRVLFSIWDTQVQDFRRYAEETGYAQRGGIYMLKDVGDRISWELDRDASWENPGFTQGRDHPVVGVNWDEAKAFCAWLTAKERKAGRIGAEQQYRLPMEEEWSAAVGESKYPWGDMWPPPEGAGNYADGALEATLPGKYVDNAFYAKLSGKGRSGFVPGNDGYSRTSPVGSFKASRLGLYDMGGNVSQWCEDWHDGRGVSARGMRGASWSDLDPEALLSSRRSADIADRRDVRNGFRCVLGPGVMEQSVPSAPAETAQPSDAITSAQLREFVEKLQLDEQSHDLDRILRNYATTVDYLDQGVVGQAAIRQDKKRYFERWPKTTYQLKDDITVLSASANRSKVRFQVEFSAERQSGEKISGIAEETIDVVQKGGLHVVSEKSRVLSRIKTSGPTAPAGNISVSPSSSPSATGIKATISMAGMWRGPVVFRGSDGSIVNTTDTIVVAANQKYVQTNWTGSGRGPFGSSARRTGDTLTWTITQGGGNSPEWRKRYTLRLKGTNNVDLDIGVDFIRGKWKGTSARASGQLTRQ